MRANIRKQLGYLLKRSVSRSERFSYFRHTICHFYRLNRLESFYTGGVYLTSLGCVNLWGKFEMQIAIAGNEILHLTIYPLPGIQY